MKYRNLAFKYELRDVLHVMVWDGQTRKGKHHPYLYCTAEHENVYFRYYTETPFEYNGLAINVDKTQWFIQNKILYSYREYYNQVSGEEKILLKLQYGEPQ